jgi:hypothetical protein
MYNHPWLDSCLVNSLRLSKGSQECTDTSKHEQNVTVSGRDTCFINTMQQVY